MNELRIKCQPPESLKRLIEDGISNRWRSLKNSIEKTEKHLYELEAKYRRSTEEFLRRYRNYEFEETLKLDEWIGEASMWCISRMKPTKHLSFFGALLVVSC